MPARDQSYEIIGNGRHAEVPYDQRDSFEYGGYSGGADNARQGMENQADRADTRTGPQIDNSQATADLARSIGARGNQQYLAGYLNNVMNGGSTPAQQQLYEQTQRGIAMQHAAAMSGHGFGAVAGADRNAALAAGQMNAAGAQTMGMQRASDMLSARDQYGSVVDAMRGGDMQSRGMLQDQAYRQASLEDEQRARNDQMAQFYLGERYKIGTAQLGANQDFERQNAATQAGQNNTDWASLQRRDAQNDAMQAGSLKMVGDGATTAASMYSDSNDDKRVRGA